MARECGLGVGYLSPARMVLTVPESLTSVLTQPLLERTRKRLPPFTTTAGLLIDLYTQPTVSMVTGSSTMMASTGQ